MITTPRASSNGSSHHVASDDPIGFAPEVQRSLQRLQSLHHGISIDAIIKKIADWTSPSEQLFYVTFIYLRNSGRIDPKIHIEEQYYVATGGKKYYVDFRISVVDELFPDLPLLFVFVECDGRGFHDRTPDEFDTGRERIRELQRQGGKAYPFSRRQLLKSPEKCVIECVRDLQRDLIARREMLMQVFL